MIKNQKYKILDLFSGLGGFSLGLERTGCFETVAFCDNNKFSKLILDKHWKGTKIYDDIREITKEKFKTDGIESPDIITGGFPCQPFSVAGKQKGTSDDRHLWPEMFRIIKAFKPRFVIGENVRGIINIQDGVVFETVCTDLESEGYEVQPFIIPASGVGAPHRRERVWIIAHREESMVNSDNIRFKQYSTTKEESSGRRSSATFESTSATNVADTENGRRQQTQSERREGTERRSIDSRGIEGERKDIGSNVADTNSGLCGRGRTIESSREDSEGSLHSKEEEQTREHLRSETIGRSSIRGETKNVADTESERLQRSRGQESDRDINGLQQNSKRIESEIRSESERCSRTFRNEETKNVADTEIIGTFRNQTQGGEGSSTQLNGKFRNGQHRQREIGRIQGRQSSIQREIFYPKQ